MAAATMIALPPPLATPTVSVHIPDAVKPAAHSKMQPAYVLPPSPPLSDDDERQQRRFDLEVAADRPRDEVFPQLEFERPLGETELSYFLPSREDGVNDMYVA